MSALAPGVHGNEITEREIVAAGLRRVAPPGAEIAALTRLTGGASLQTWAYEECGAGRVRRLVLRRRGSGERDLFETSVPLATEATLIERAAAEGAPVAGIVYRCEPDDGLGEAYVTTRIDGETLGRRIVADASMARARARLGAQCGDALARIHRMDGALLALETLDAAATLDRYEAIYRKGSRDRPAIEAAIAWLRARTPEPVPPRLVHGDFRTGNLIVTSEHGLAAVLDWELAHFGDPAEDFGWLCVNSWRFGQTGLAAGGFASLEAVLESYAAAGGAAPSPARIAWWQAMGSLRWAVITMMMYRSFSTGANRSLERALIGRRTSECEADLVALMREKAWCAIQQSSS